MSTPCHPGSMLSTPTVFDVAPSATESATTMSVGSTSALPSFSAFARSAAAVSIRSSSRRELPDALALRGQEREGHPPADEEFVDLRQQVVDDAYLVRDLGAAEDRDVRMPGVVRRLREIEKLRLYQEAHRPPVEELRHADGGGVRSVRGAERVVDVDVAHPAQTPREVALVLRLARVEPQVLEQQHVAVASSAPPGPRSCRRRSRAPSRPRVPSSFARRAAAGLRLIARTTSPLGLPRWDVRTALPPDSTMCLIVGRALRMRVSSVTEPSRRQWHVEVHAGQDSLCPARSTSVMCSFSCVSDHLTCWRPASSCRPCETRIRPRCRTSRRS